MLGRIWGKMKPHTMLGVGGCKLVQPVWKTVWRLLKKLKLELPYDPAIPVLGIYLKECESGNSKDNCISIFTEALFILAKL
jgi:hypothetical protein